MSERPRDPEEIVEQTVNEIESQEEMTELNQGDDEFGGSEELDFDDEEVDFEPSEDDAE